jgi:hypothetical protein
VLSAIGSYAVAAGGLAAFTLLLHLFAMWTSGVEANDKRRGLLALIVGADNRVSTSKLQLLMWTYAIAFVLLAIVLEGRADDILTTGLETQYLLLLGIPVVGAAGAAVITSSKVQSGTIDKPSDPSTAASTALTGIRDGLADVVTDDSGRGDLGDFQYFVFNLVALTYFFTNFFSGTQDALPTIPDTLVALTGASAFAYLSKKGVINDAPKLTGIYPSTVARGDQVTVRGVNLVGPSSPAASVDPSRGLKLLFGGLQATGVDATDATAVLVTVPETTPIGQTDVKAVTSAGVETESLPFQVVQGGPEILGVRPTKIVLGTDSELTVDGFGFGTQPGGVLLDGRSLGVKVWGANQVVADLPTLPATGFSAAARTQRDVDSRGRPSSDFPVEIAGL